MDYSGNTPPIISLNHSNQVGCGPCTLWLTQCCVGHISAPTRSQLNDGFCGGAYIVSENISMIKIFTLVTIYALHLHSHPYTSTITSPPHLFSSTSTLPPSQFTPPCLVTPALCYSADGLCQIVYHFSLSVPRPWNVIATTQGQTPRQIKNIGLLGNTVTKHGWPRSAFGVISLGKFDLKRPIPVCALNFQTQCLDLIVFQVRLNWLKSLTVLNPTE